MEIRVRTTNSTIPLQAREGETVLAVLQRNHVQIDAVCGGNGTCCKCKVFVHDSYGITQRLACKTLVSEGMEVAVRSNLGINVSLKGLHRLWPLDDDAWGYGISFDVGTTTLVARLYDLETNELMGEVGMPNPQSVYGVDVISRITACEQGHLKDMTDLLGDALLGMVSSLADSAQVAPSDITHVVLAGNTVMEHIAAGFSPVSIGAEPFAPVTCFGYDVDYLALCSSDIAAGVAFFAPCISGYVGGDIVCGLLAVDILHAHQPMLFMDLGTNGELALGDKNGVTTCATAAGPVLEGGNITCGMPAFLGAIARASYENGKLSCQVIGNEKAEGVCGTGVIDAIALMIEHGIVDETGRLKGPDDVDLTRSQGLERYLEQDDDGLYCLRLTPDVIITQQDVRNVQLAKASICAGVLKLVADKGLELSDIDMMLIAGGFGEYLDLGHAATVGLFPKELLGKARCVGNTAIEGASAVLLSEKADDELDRIVDFCRYIELSEDPAFSSLYIDNMNF